MPLTCVAVSCPAKSHRIVISLCVTNSRRTALVVIHTKTDTYRPLNIKIETKFLKILRFGVPQSDNACSSSLLSFVCCSPIQLLDFVCEHLLSVQGFNRDHARVQPRNQQRRTCDSD